MSNPVGGNPSPITGPHANNVDAATPQVSSQESSAPQGPTQPLFTALQGELTQLYKTLTKQTALNGDAKVTPAQIEAHFANLTRANLKQDPEIAPLLEKLENFKALTNQWQNPSADWKKGVKDFAPNADAMRREVVNIVSQITDVLAKRAGLPEAGWVNIGSPGKNSDIDLSIKANADGDHVFQDNAIQGQKAAMAGLVWRALFNGTSLQQADTEFYPPHIGGYLREELHDETAKAIYSRASVAAALLQSTQLLHSEDLTQFKDLLDTEFKKNKLAGALPAINEMIKDVENFQENVLSMATGLPHNHKDLINNIMSSKLSANLAELGKQIDAAPKGTPEREKLIAKYYFLSVVRARFLPEGYLAKGTYAVTCEDKGGQAHVTQDREAQALAEKTGAVIKREAPQFKESTPDSLLESLCENGLFFCHRHDLVDASKYGTRFYASSLDLTKKMLGELKSKDPSSPKIAELTILKVELEAKLLDMKVLEATKREKWDEISVTKEVAQAYHDRDVKQITAAHQHLLRKENEILKENDPTKIVERYVAELEIGLGVESGTIATELSAKELMKDRKLATLIKDFKESSLLHRLAGPTKEEKKALFSRLEKITAIRAKTKIALSKISTKAAQVMQKHFGKTQFGGEHFVPNPKVEKERIQDIHRDLSTKEFQPLFGGRQAARILPWQVQGIATQISGGKALNALAVSKFSTLSQAQYTKEVIEKMKMKRHLSDSVSNEDLFKELKKEVLGSLVKMLVLGVGQGVIAEPQPLDPNAAVSGQRMSESLVLGGAS